MFCQKCGKEIPDDAANCSGCGAEMQAQSKPPVAVDITKKSLKDSVTVIKSLALNPVGELAKTFESLGASRARNVGIVFGIFFSLAVAFGVFPFFSYYGQNKLTIFLSIFFSAAILFASLSLACMISRSMMRGTGAFGQDIFIAGVSLLPLGIWSILFRILGVGNIEVIAILFTFAICYTILILFAGCARLAKLSEGFGAAAVPIMIIACAWITKIIFMALLK